MRVWRGRGESVQADREASDRLVDSVVETDEPALRVWYPHRHVAFGRRDASTEGYERARDVARERGFPLVERTVGGRAVAFTGEVLAFVLAEPADAAEPTIDARYERTLETLGDELTALGADVRRGEPRDSFCPGTHSLQADGTGDDGGRAAGKVAGLAQRVQRDVAVVAGAVVVANPTAVAGVLAPVYDALGLPFNSESVGSIEGAGARDVDPADVRDRIEDAFVGERARTVRTVRDT